MAERTKTYQINKNKYLLDAEVSQLENVLNKFENKFERDCLLLSVALYTGGRAQEVLNIDKADLNFHEQTIFIRGLKGSNDREIPLPYELFQRLNHYSKTTNSTKIFDICYQRFSQIWNQYRPVPKKLHSLRHTFAIRLYKKTKDLRLVQVALGHRNITNTMVYADYVYTQTEMRKLLL